MTIDALMTTPPFHDTLTIDGDGHPVVAHIAGAPPGAAATIVASHGIAANAISYSRIAEELADAATFVALDHRGRADSGKHPGPYGMAAHARDCVSVLDRLGVDSGVMVGHSMGAFIIARAASDFADRVAAAVFIDGGLPIALPDGVEPRDAVDAVVGPALTRLRLTWSAHDELYDMWKGHPAFATWDRWQQRYVDHDVEKGADGRLHCRVHEEAVRFDGAEAIVDPRASRLLAKVASPAWLLRAPRGVLDDPATPILSEEALADLRRIRPDIEIVAMAADVNHYNILWSDSGAPMVAATLTTALAAT